ncbi:MAG TPA: hypothetical protein VGM31_16395, partial [Puia sp.]
MKITLPVDRQPYWKDVVVILIAFTFSRVLSALFGIHLGYDALFRYWQYLDTTTLRDNLLRGLWYDHAQPPFFNLILGLVLKTSGNSAPIVFASFLKCISLANCLLLLAMLRRLIKFRYIPLIITLIYLLSPALIIFESELFYTTFISMLLLISAWFVLRLQDRVAAGGPFRSYPDISGTAMNSPAKLPWKYVIGIFLPLIVLCLTRSMYHVVWLAAASVCLLFAWKRTPAFRPLLTGALCSVLLVGGWYLKNYMIFGQFSTSSWLGMNLARTVFYQYPVTDSSQIATIEPFSPLQYYHGFTDTSD